jgi:hypothetical protein
MLAVVCETVWRDGLARRFGETYLRELVRELVRELGAWGLLSIQIKRSRL